MKRAAAPAVLAVALFFPAYVRAEVVRYAVIAGNNRGAASEPNLRFAEDDAQKLAGVLLDLGGFLPENTLVLKGRDAGDLRRALIAFNDRIRSRIEDPTVQPLLVVYFSGHADARALHLGGTELEFQEIEQLVRGSAAAYRLLIIDACRSGSLTHVKGGSSAPPFPIRLEEHLEGEGVVFLTSSAGNEDAQESDELGGSFFTHYLVSGLLGAADQNDDGRVALREAYAYAYDHTLRASSRTLVGPQHPTFDYELRGKDDLALTEIASASGTRAVIEVPERHSYLIMQGTGEGSVIAEVDAADRLRRISVKPGRYFVRSRTRDHLLEGTVTALAGTKVEVDEAKLDKIAYARLVRKGGTPSESGASIAHGPELGYRLESPLGGTGSLCQGAFAGYSVDLHALSFGPRAGFCRGGFANEALGARTDQFDLLARLAHAFDLPLVSIEVGLGAGGAVIHQSFQTQGRAPDRFTGAAELAAGVGLEMEIDAGIFVRADVEAVTYLFREDSIADNGARSTRLVPSMVGRLGLALAKRW